MNPINKYDLTAEERKGALRYLMFLKENAVERLRAAAVLMVGNNGTTCRKTIHPPQQLPLRHYYSPASSTQSKGATSQHATSPAPSCNLTWKAKS